MLSILGVGYSHPSIEVDNNFLEALEVGTNAQWIEEKIGILKRVVSIPLDYIKKSRNQDPREALKVATHTSTDLAISAAKMALDRAKLKPSQIGMIIVDCCTPSETSPVESHRVAKALGIEVPSFDVFTACPAFALHMEFLANYREEELPEYVLCLSSNVLSHKVNYNERSDGAIWGDGAAAWIISAKHEGKLRVLDTYFTADPTRNQAVVVNKYGHFWQDGRAVRDFSVRQTVRLVKRAEELFDLDWTRDIFIGHQANKTMLEQITNNRNISDENHWHNVTEIGNQAGAGAPAALAMNWDEIKSGQKVLIAVVGAGLSWGSVLLEAA